MHMTSVSLGDSRRVPRSHLLDLRVHCSSVSISAELCGTQVLGNPRIPVGEKQRLAAEHDRASQVAAAIDQAAAKEPQ